MFPFDIEITSGFQIATYPAGATFGPRRTHDFELVWMIEGDAEYHVVEQCFPAPQGSIVLCKPETTDFFRWDVRRRTRHGWFHFHLHGFPPAEWGTISDWATVRVPKSENDLLPILFRQLITDFGTAYASTASRLLALSLLAAFVSQETERPCPVEDSPYPEPVARAMAFIAGELEAQPNVALPITDIARAAFVTPEHLCRLFKAHTKHTPAETVRLLRLDRAALLLARTNFSVGEIAALCGFPSQFHFARRFKEAFGQSPSDLRRAIASGHSMVPITRLVQL